MKIISIIFKMYFAKEFLLQGVRYLSVLILAKNEEKNIKACIESVLPIADEVVVIDDESTDHTADAGPA